MKVPRPFLALVTVSLLIGCAGSEAKTHSLDGSVLIFHERNFTKSGTSCQGTGGLFDLIPGSPVRITPKGKDPIITRLGTGAISPEGNCRLRFTPTIPEASSYLFEIGGRLPITRPKSHIDNSNGSRDGWWVTFDWDSNDNPVPRP
ncbi:MAG: hypothetical protein QOJ59_1294 [Thermomicrobiales bacterium]|jgi:hypothetical protein|nr:hypothetical protein [Thermomicrobiales bacterium]